jgi:hypothetical protein
VVVYWSGKFKGLDTGRDDYKIPEEVWEGIWRETSEAMKDIPSASSRKLGVSGFYLGPQHSSKASFFMLKYHKHACDLAEIIKVCLEFEIT